MWDNDILIIVLPFITHLCVYILLYIFSRIKTYNFHGFIGACIIYGFKASLMYSSGVYMKLLERACYHIINMEVDWKTALEADIVAHTQLRTEGCTCCTSLPWGMG